MKVVICQVETGPQGARIGQVKALGAWWVQFGDKVLLYAAKSKWNTVRNNAERGGLSLEEYPDDIRKEDMHLVVQKGRLFQKEYPTIPVLLDKGRYLVVKLSPKEVEKIGVRKEPCFVIQPLKENIVVFDIRTQPSARVPTVAWIQDLVDNVTRSGFETTIQHLVSYLTRYSTSSHYTDAATWCRGQLDSMGYSTTVESISVNGETSSNVIADKLGGSSGSRELVLVVAHLDSINASGGLSASAPGADDNASGSAGLLKIARILKNHASVHDLRFVLFGGEEQGLDGSTQYVSSLSTSERSRIRAIVNMDMIGTLNTSDPTVLLEGSTVSQTVIDDLSDMAFTYTSLTVQTSLYPYASDHVPFINAGLPAVLTIEGADSANSNIHSAEDTIDHIDYDLVLEILRMNVGYVATKLEKKGGSIMNKYELSELKEVLKSFEDYHGKDIFVKYRWRLSGRYTYNGGTGAWKGLTTRASRYEYPIGPIEGPIYSVEDIAYGKKYEGWKELFKLRFTLHIDIDGTDPLDVVSGTVAKGLYPITFPLPHFVGRVTSNTLSGGVINLVVEDFSFQWPGATDTIDRLEIALTGRWFFKPTADVTFIDTSRDRRHGPYSVEQESIYFHDIEAEIDREDNAVDVEPYNTHTHPDRPADLTEENLTIERAFAKAGIRITRSSESNIINTSDAGGDNRWTYQELHDAMEDHWSAFINKAQWKMWIFLAELATSDGLGGVMFDAYIDEPGGVDRQGTAIFTKCPWFHSATGGYIVDNPPEDEAVQRELCFNFIHETGHAFNLYHSFSKTSGTPWAAPSWMPVITDDCALSWMNYPERASQNCGGSTDNNATWFYTRFRFRFDDNENLFLRHAPASYVQMGHADWGEDHGRVSRSSLDRRLELVVRSRKQIVELGESVFLELRLRNISDKPVMVHRNLDPSDDFVQLAVTNPHGERRPFIPFIHTRAQVQQHTLEPGESLYHSVNLTIGKFGFPFKEPGPYRIEASYKNIYSGTAAAIMQLWVRPPANYDDMPVISELFNARIGRVLYVGGSRLMEDVNEKIDWIHGHLSKAHPAKYYLSAVKGIPLVKAYKVLRADSDKERLLEPDSDNAERLLTPLIENMEAAADSLGHITYRHIVDTYTKSALDTNKKSRALKAQKNVLEMFKKRAVVRTVIESIERRVKELK